MDVKESLLSGTSQQKRCQGHSNHCWHRTSQSRRRRSKSTSFPEPNLPQNVRFHQTPRSQNHRSRVPNPSRASIAAAQPLKHVETRKNEVLNSTKTKQFCRICDFENHRHAQKLFVIIVASGLECRRHRFMCTWLNMEDCDGDRRWLSSLKPFNLFPLIPAYTARPGLPLLPASSARPGLPLSAPANGFDDERHRQSPSHHSFESVIYT